MSIMVHVGLDAHQGSIRMNGLCSTTGKALFEHRITNDVLTVKKQFSKLATQYEMRCCYEASGGGYVLHRWLTEMGIHCDVIAPSLIPVRPGDHVKTDRRDAKKLAELYRAGLLTVIHVPTPEQESARRLLRLRDSVSGDVRRAKNEMHKFLAQLGQQYGGKSYWTDAHWRWLRTLRFGGSDQLVWDEYRCSLEHRIGRLAELDRAIEALAATQDYREPVAKLCCLRGVATLTAMTLLTELVDFTRFPSASAVMCYVGLVPREHSSGDRQRQGGITKAGNSRVRRALIQAAWKYQHKPARGHVLRRRQEGQPADVIAHCWKAQQRLNKKYHAITSRTKVPQKAVTAVARELAGFVWSLMTQFSSQEKGLTTAAA